MTTKPKSKSLKFNIESAITAIAEKINAIYERLTTIETAQRQQPTATGAAQPTKVYFNPKHYKRVPSDTLLDLGDGIYGEVVEMQRVKFTPEDGGNIIKYGVENKQSTFELSTLVSPNGSFELDPTLWQVQTDATHQLSQGSLTVTLDMSYAQIESLMTYQQGVPIHLTHPDLTAPITLWVMPDDFSLQAFMDNLQIVNDGLDTITVSVENRYLPKTPQTAGVGQLYLTVADDPQSHLDRAMFANHRFEYTQDNDMVTYVITLPVVSQEQLNGTTQLAYWLDVPATKMTLADISRDL